MSTFHPQSLLLFAHRGGMAHFPENTLQAFDNAWRMGAPGIESDAFVTSDGVVVLDHDGIARKWWQWRSRPFSELPAADLPSHIPTLHELYQLVGTEMDISLDVKGEATIEPLLDTVRSYGPELTDRLWLAHKGYTHSDWREVASWRELDAAVHLIDSTAPYRLDLAPREYVKRAADHGIEVLNMRAADWTPELIDVALAAGLRAFAFSVVGPTTAANLLKLGITGLFADDVTDLLAVRGLEPS